MHTGNVLFKKSAKCIAEAVFLQNFAESAFFLEK